MSQLNFVRPHLRTIGVSLTCVLMWIYIYIFLYVCAMCGWGLVIPLYTLYAYEYFGSPSCRCWTPGFSCWGSPLLLFGWARVYNSLLQALNIPYCVIFFAFLNRSLCCWEMRDSFMNVCSPFLGLSSLSSAVFHFNFPWLGDILTIFVKMAIVFFNGHEWWPLTWQR